MVINQSINGISGAHQSGGIIWTREGNRNENYYLYYFGPPKGRSYEFSAVS